MDEGGEINEIMAVTGYPSLLALMECLLFVGNVSRPHYIL